MIESLSFLATRANEVHRDCKANIRSGLVRAKEIGDLLLKAKAQMPKGEWCKWQKENLSFSQPTAASYMRVSRCWEGLKDAGDMTLNKAIRETMKSNRRSQNAHDLSDEEEESRFDPLASLRASGDGDLVDILVTVLSERDHAADIIEKVKSRLPKKKAAKKA